jgi:hypothetical protein
LKAFKWLKPTMMAEQIEKKSCNNKIYFYME